MRFTLLLVILIAVILLAAGIPIPAARSQETSAVFKADVRFVEIHATITDRKGRFVSGLQPDQFEIRDNGEVQPIALFEPVSSGVKCAILLDCTGSMENVMPSLKAAVLSLIDAFRENDWFAVYTFNTTVRRISALSQEKAAAKRAVLGTMAYGATALFDSLDAVLTDLMIEKGKKAVIVFTDGQDNSSYLYSSAVVRRTRSLGIPIYAIAQGEALKDPELLKLLATIGVSTGGRAYQVRKSSDFDSVFAMITDNLRQGYMLGYVAPPATDPRWRTIQLAVKGVNRLRIHAREGYFPK